MVSTLSPPIFSTKYAWGRILTAIIILLSALPIKPAKTRPLPKNNSILILNKAIFFVSISPFLCEQLGYIINYLITSLIFLSTNYLRLSCIHKQKYITHQDSPASSSKHLSQTPSTLISTFFTTTFLPFLKSFKSIDITPGRKHSIAPHCVQTKCG